MAGPRGPAGIVQGLATSEPVEYTNEPGPLFWTPGKDFVIILLVSR
jgi:hypothetical protein